MTKLIGISGKAESGKSTAAGFIEAVWPRARSTAFADTLKLEALASWMETTGREHPYRQYMPMLSDERKLEIAGELKANPAFRTHLQEFGQAARALDEDYWVLRCVVRHRELHGIRPHIVPDVRYENEARYVLSHGGLLLRVERPGHENRLTEMQRAHPSETALDEWDWDDNLRTHPGWCARVLNPGARPEVFLRNLLLEVRPYLGGLQ